MSRSTRFSPKRVALCGLLLSLMLILGYVESLIPAVSAVPGIKLGLSNGVLIFAIYMLDVPTSFVLMALKVVLSGALFGNPNAMLYAFSGGLLSVVAMVLLSKIKGLHPVTISMVGGVMHNVGQVGMAMIQLQTSSLVYYMAILMIVGLVCGALTGVCATHVMKHLKHFR